MLTVEEHQIATNAQTALHQAVVEHQIATMLRQHCIMQWQIAAPAALHQAVKKEAVEVQGDLVS